MLKKMAIDNINIALYLVTMIFGVNPILLPGDLEALGGFGDFLNPSTEFSDFVEPDLLSGPISFCNIFLKF